MVAVPDDQLPVRLPEIEDYAPKGRSPLAAAEDWVEPPARSAAGRRGARPTPWTPSSTPPGTSCATATRTTTRRAWDRDVPGPLDAGGPVHRRRGARDPAPALRALLRQGAERPRTCSSANEPFAHLFTQGMITRDGAKMSKSKGNAVSPQDLVQRQGADTARCYILFIGPPEHDADWQDEGVGGVRRFLSRLWTIGHEVAMPAAVGASRRPPRPRRSCARRTGRSRRSRATCRAGSPSTRRSRP